MGSGLGRLHIRITANIASMVRFGHLGSGSKSVGLVACREFGKVLATYLPSLTGLQDGGDGGEVVNVETDIDSIVARLR